MTAFPAAKILCPVRHSPERSLPDPILSPNAPCMKSFLTVFPARYRPAPRTGSVRAAERLRQGRPFRRAH